jgi:hypothetical protein
MNAHDPATLRVATQVFGAAGAAVGLATVAFAPRAAALAARSGYSVPDARIVRVLGARQAVQGVATALEPSAAVLGLGSVVDLSHALSMVPVIASWTRFRRPATISAALAAASAAMGAVLARRSAPRTS